MKKKLSLIFNLGVPCAIILYSLFFHRKSLLCPYVITLAAIALAAYGVALASKNRFSHILKSAVTIFTITYLLLECSTYFLLSFGIIRPDIHFFYRGLEATDRKVVVYDSICGYKCIPGMRRYVSINNGKLEIDHLTKANRQGWFSAQDYSYKKRNAKIKRYMVLGDSFSSGLVIPTPWSDLAQRMFAESGNDSIELYNFSFDGSGIANWYRIFFLEIAPQYEFDGIIIAASAEKDGVPDFDRKFIMAQSQDDANYIQAIDISKQQPPPHFLMENAVAMSRIFSNSELDKMKNAYTGKKQGHPEYKPQAPALCFLRTFYGITDGLYKMISFTRHFMLYSKPYETYYTLADSAYRMEYFDNRYPSAFMLKEILAYCKDHGKDVALVSIPDYDHALDYVNGREFIYHKEHQFLAEFYHLKYYDGFEMFTGKDENFVNQCFYEYDRHWNETGVQLFTEKITASGVF